MIKYLRFILVSGFLASAQAFSSGAGGCAGGAAAVSGLHLSSGAVTGSFTTGGLSLLVNGKKITNGGTVTISLNALNTLVVDRGTKQYKGILYRLAPVGTVATSAYQLTPVPGSTTTQAASVCSSPVVGVTHTSSILKNKVGARLKVTKAATFSLGITIVIQNSGGRSEYYYQSFTVKAVAAPKKPVKKIRRLTGSW
jgi:hypothetical protein